MTEEVKKTEAVVAPVAEETTKKQKKSSRRQIQKGRASIQCTYNNTIISLTDINGNVLAWSSSGHMGFKGAKKSTPYAATQVVADVTEKVKKFGLQEVEVFVNGVGNGREAAIRALANNGFSILGIKDTTSVPHGGCRPRRPRRI
jgi:small subunit ribosomal protein S11